jgi:hypothetical protein
MAQALRRILTDRRLAGRLAARARRRALDYDWDGLAGRVLSIYQDVPHRHRHGQGKGQGQGTGRRPAELGPLR